MRHVVLDWRVDVSKQFIMHLPHESKLLCFGPTPVNLNKRTNKICFTKNLCEFADRHITGDTYCIGNSILHLHYERYHATNSIQHSIAINLHFVGVISITAV